MDRLHWLAEKRRSTRERYDTLFAPTYDEQWGSVIATTHKRFFVRFLEICPPQAHILDAACGTGKYWPLILASGRRVTGIDQSQGMLDCAHAKFPVAHIERAGLQEMTFRESFDAACCMDAMEFVFPEDWPFVLHNLHCAIKPGGYLYLTVELADEQALQSDYIAGRQAGLPVVYGESAQEAGYHYYPRIEQVRKWMQQAGFHPIGETEGDEYHHFLVQKLIGE